MSAAIAGAGLRLQNPAIGVLPRIEAKRATDMTRRPGAQRWSWQPVAISGLAGTSAAVCRPVPDNSASRASGPTITRSRTHVPLCRSTPAGPAPAPCARQRPRRQMASLCDLANVVERCNGQAHGEGRYRPPSAGALEATAVASARSRAVSVLSYRAARRSSLVLSLIVLVSLLAECTRLGYCQAPRGGYVPTSVRRLGDLGRCSVVSGDVRSALVAPSGNSPFRRYPFVLRYGT